MQQGKGFGDTAVNMDLTIEGLNGVKDTVELGEDDTTEKLREKVASAVGLCEDGFVMSFGGVAMDEGYDMTQLSAGDTVVLTKVKNQNLFGELSPSGEGEGNACSRFVWGERHHRHRPPSYLCRRRRNVEGIACAIRCWCGVPSATQLRRHV